MTKKLVENDIKEWSIYIGIRSILLEEVAALNKNKHRTEDDIAVLEKLTRIYANIKDDLREDLKSELWKKLDLSP